VTGTSRRRWSRQVSGDRWLPLLLVFTTLVATTVFGTRPLISYLALSLGAGPAELGMIASAFAVLAIAGAIPLGRLIDRVGERPIMSAGAMLCATVCALLPAMDSIFLLAVAMALLGIGQMMAVVGAHTMLASHGPVEKRPFRIGLYTSAASLGHAIGPASAGIIIGDDVSGGAASVALLGAAGVSILAAMLAVPLPGPAREHARADGHRLRPSARATLRLPGMVPALTAGVISLTAVDILVAYLPAYGEERAISPQTIGFALATLSLAQMISRIGLGWLLERFGHVAVLVGSIALAAVVIPVLILQISEPLLLAVMAVAGLGLGLAQPLTLVWVAVATPPESRGLAMGVRMGGNRFGQLLVPVAVGATAGQLGIAAILATVAGLLAGGAAYVIRARAQFVNAGVPVAPSAVSPPGEP
jgi:MFS family permease